MTRTDRMEKTGRNGTKKRALANGVIYQTTNNTTQTTNSIFCSRNKSLAFKIINGMSAAYSGLKGSGEKRNRFSRLRRIDRGLK